MKKIVRDRDMLETLEGFFFTVVGYAHPPDRIFAYLKYLPSKKKDTGIWERDNVQFQRVIPEYSAARVVNTFKFLEENYPDYLFSCPVNNILMSAVPYNKIQTLYHADYEFQRLVRKEKRDSLEEKLVQLANLLIEQFDLKQEDIGITGSIALQIHHPNYSDIDLIVFGRTPAKRLAEKLPTLIADHPSLRVLSQKELEEITQRKVTLFGLSPQKTILLLDRKWNLGVFAGTRFAILPVRRPTEVNDNYGDRIYYNLGQATIVAKVINAQDSWFNPAIYKVSVQQFIDGPRVSNLRMLVSWENFFANVAKEGETVLTKGKLERVEEVRTHKSWYRLLVGSGGSENEYILPHPLQ